MKIDFKIWDTENDKWVFNGDSGIRYALSPNGDVFDIKWSEFKPNFKPILCTGIKDKIGQYLYDGDIVEFDENEWGSSENRFTMKWDDDESRWTIGAGVRSDIPAFCHRVGSIFDPLTPPTD